MKTKIVTEAAYLQGVDEMMGWCTDCKAFTTPECENDAQERICPDCDQPTAMGAEDALIMGEIEIGDPPEPEEEEDERPARECHHLDWWDATHGEE